MLDFAWTEMALVAAIALIFIGPKDLPRVLRQIGIWVRKLRLLAGEFQKNVDEMVREAELDDVKRDVERLGRVDIGREIEKTVDPKGEVERALNLDDVDKPKLASIPTGPAAEPSAAADQPPVPQTQPEAPPRPDDKADRP